MIDQTKPVSKPGGERRAGGPLTWTALVGALLATLIAAGAASCSEGRLRSASPLSQTELDGLVRGSDDYAKHRSAFVTAAEALIDDYDCAPEHFVAMGGFVISEEVDNRYFVYCRDGQRMDVLIEANLWQFHIANDGAAARRFPYTELFDRSEDVIIARIRSLEVRASDLSASDIPGNLALYRELVVLAPERKDFARKLATYEALGSKSLGRDQN